MYKCRKKKQEENKSRDNKRAHGTSEDASWSPYLYVCVCVCVEQSATKKIEKTTTRI